MPDPLTRRVELLGRRFEAPPLIVTLWQPYAELIAAGIKPVEYRGWTYPKAYEGQRIAIHAAKRPLDDDWLRQVEECFELFHKIDGPSDPAYVERWRFRCDQLRGCVVAVATLAGCERANVVHPVSGLACYGWKLRDVVRAKARLFRGRQGITRFDRWIETYTEGEAADPIADSEASVTLARQVARAVDLDWQYLDHPLQLARAAAPGAAPCVAPCSDEPGADVQKGARA